MSKPIKRASKKPRRHPGRRMVGGYRMTNAHSHRRADPLVRPLKVAELFAGVGGFRLGLEAVEPKGAFEIVWGNQWEPSTKAQAAFEIYSKKFTAGVHSNHDISKVDFAPGRSVADADGLKAPDVDVLVGGFPCQDYSVARTLKQATGLVGKKGVLWWQIHRFLVEKGEKKPALLVLENVDRLLKSPANQRGRDFAVLLASLDHLGYTVEWRVINAADYGLPQRRRRVFIVGYHRSLAVRPADDPKAWLLESGVMAQAFPVSAADFLVGESKMEHEDLPLISESFNKGGLQANPFFNTGLFAYGKYWTVETKPVYDGERKLLGQVLIPEDDVPPEYYIPENELPRWRYLKGAKAEARINSKTGFKYNYTEGPIAFPDSLDRPSRTIITSEGGRTPSRFKHVVKVGRRYRRLTPLELERLNGFPDGHTLGLGDGRRAFLMGNALVVDIVRRIGQSLCSRIFREVLGKKYSERRQPAEA